MATATRTRKPATKKTAPKPKKPVTLEDHMNAWLSGIKTRFRKKFQKAYREFLVCSTIAFWAFAAGYILVHWPF